MIRLSWFGPTARNPPHRFDCRCGGFVRSGLVVGGHRYGVPELFSVSDTTSEALDQKGSASASTGSVATATGAGATVWRTVRRVGRAVTCMTLE